MIWSRACRAARRKHGTGGGSSARESFSVTYLVADFIGFDEMTSQRRKSPIRLSSVVMAASFGVPPCVPEGGRNPEMLAGAPAVGTEAAYSASDVVEVLWLR